MAAGAVTPPLPPGFELESAPPLPPGFELEQPGAPGAAAAPEPRATGLQAAMTAQQRDQALAQIPGAGGYTAPAAVRPMPVQPAREPTAAEKVIGAVEAGVATFRQLVNGTPGAIVGGLLGAAEDVGQLVQGKRPDPGNLERRAQQGVALASNPMGLQERPLTPAGQEYTEAIGGALQELPAYVPAIGPAQGLAGSMGAARTLGAAETAAAAVPQPVRAGLAGAMERVGTVADRVLQRLPEKTTAGTKPAAGAAGTDVATQRRERAASLPVPIKLTKGQAERTFEQQRFERETAKDPETGKPLRDRYAEQQAQLQQNLDALVELTGAEAADRVDTGSKVVKALGEKAAAAKRKISAAYKAADDAGETLEQVSTEQLVRKLEEVEPSATNAGVIKTAEQELIRLGGASRDGDGRLVPGTISLKNLEELRKTIGVGGRKDATNAEFSRQLRDVIDSSTEDAGGDLYKAARGMYRDYAREFKNQSLVASLIDTKKGTDQRKVALEDVHRRAVLGGSLDDLARLRESLRSGGDLGKQAWRELQGRTIAEIRDTAFSNSARDERGQAILSPAKLDRAIAQLDKDNKLELLFGKGGAQQLRDLNDLAKDINTAPPGAVNASNTASVVVQALDTLLTYSTSGLPVPALTALRAARQKLKERGVRKQVREALGPDGEAAPAKPLDLSARPFEPPEPTPTPSNPGGAPAAPAPTAGAAAAPDARIAEIERLREGASAEVRRVLEEQAAVARAEQRKAQEAKQREADVQQLEALAQQTTDTALRAALTKRANELRPEQIPVGEATELSGAAADGRAPEMGRLPVGEAREIPGTPETVRAVDDLMVDAENEIAWRKLHRFGDLDARAAQDVARAIRYDADAVDRAMVQHERSPRAFEREVQRIIEEGKARESQTEQAGASGEGLDQAPGAAPGRAPAQPRADRRDGAATAGAERGEPVRAGRQGEEGLGEAAARAAKHLDARDDVTPRLRREILQRYNVAERAKPVFDEAMHSALRDLGAEGREVKLADIKGPERAVAKILADYGGEADRIKDLVRGTLVIREIGSVKSAIAALESRFGKLHGLRNGLDPEAPPVTSSGYRDAKANVMINGQLAEVQVSVPEMMAAKKEAHPLYERFEEIQRRIERAGRDATPDEAAELAELEARQQKIYAAAWESSLRRSASEATSARNASSETSVPLRSQELPGNRRGSAPSTSHARYANSGERVTGTPSTSKNKVPAGNDAGSFMAGTSAPIIGENPVGRRTIATTERGVEIPVQYRLVDVGQLITSHDDGLRPDKRFPAELQPRDRSRSSSEAQIARIANDIRPELLAESPKASDGAPIVGIDGVVESGNARTIALRRAYAAGNADAYRTWLQENAGRFGLSRAEVDRFERPMLVREGIQPYDRADFAKQANESAVSAMSETELARSDADRLPDLEDLSTNDDGTVNLSRSADFVRDFMRMAVGPNERNALMTSDGRLSQRGMARIRNAVFAKAYGDAEIVAALTEATDAGAKNVLAGLLRAAPDVARLRVLIEAGARQRVDFVPDLVEAVRRFTQAREEGMTVEQALGQGSLIGGEASPRVGELMRELERNARAPRRVADMVQRFVDEIDAQGDPRQAGMFEGV